MSALQHPALWGVLSECGLRAVLEETAPPGGVRWSTDRTARQARTTLSRGNAVVGSLALWEASCLVGQLVEAALEEGLLGLVAA